MHSQMTMLDRVIQSSTLVEIHKDNSMTYDVPDSGFITLKWEKDSFDGSSPYMCFVYKHDDEYGDASSRIESSKFTINWLMS